MPKKLGIFFWFCLFALKLRKKTEFYDPPPLQISPPTDLTNLQTYLPTDRWFSISRVLKYYKLLDLPTDRSVVLNMTGSQI